MPTALIPLGTDAATSDPITLGANETAHLFFVTDDGKHAVSENRFVVDFQSDTGAWTPNRYLGAYNVMSVTIPAKTTFRVRRNASASGSARPVSLNMEITAAAAGGSGGSGSSGAITSVDIGTQADAVATSDTGTFSLIAFVKRLLGKFPVLTAGGRMPVDGSGVTQPVSGPLTNAELRTSGIAVTVASQPLPTGASTEATVAAMSAKLPAALGPRTSALSLSVGPATDALFPVNSLAALGAAKVVAANASTGVSTVTALTTTTRRISIIARLSDLRYTVGTGTPTASGTSHFIAMGERLDLAVPASSSVAALSATTTAGFLEITELA